VTSAVTVIDDDVSHGGGLVKRVARDVRRSGRDRVLPRRFGH
jgi:hypothetical protein